MKEKAVSSKREFGIRGLFQDKSRLFVFSASVILGFFLFRFVYAALFASMKKDTAVIHRNLAEESTTSTAKPSFYESFEFAISLFCHSFENIDFIGSSMRRKMKKRS